MWIILRNVESFLMQRYTKNKSI